MAKQLYYSKIHLKNIEIYFIAILPRMYYEVHDVIKYMQNITSGIILTADG